MACGCDNDVDSEAAAHSPGYVRVLWFVVAMNAAMFVIGAVVTAASGSVSVQADLLDFLGDALATGIGLVLIRRSATTRARVSLWQGVALALLGLLALGSAVLRATSGAAPEPLGMSVYGLLGFIVNLSAALLLLRHRQGDASVRAVWLYSRNDAIGNVAVIAAAGAVALLESRSPDVIVGAILAALFLSSAWEIIGRARRELREARS
jgi:Co/Zn/Cd efflux system component